MAFYIDLAGRTALITGATGGLGAHFARTLAAAGAKVILGGRRIEALEALASSIAAAGGQAVALGLDVSDPSALAEAVSDAPHFDILVNNAGIVREAAAIAVTESDWDAVIDTNLKGMFLMAQAGAKRMREVDGGSIINIASILGLRQGHSLCCFEGGCDPDDQGSGAGVGALQHSRECYCSRLHGH
jgi:NAD(P)-dependent dehydrogenase (short-subunit alcohol dehydrogenase family)